MNDKAIPVDVWKWKATYFADGDPILQDVKFYAEMVAKFSGERYFHATTFPVILVGVKGHVMEIATAVILEKIVVNELFQLNFSDIYPAVEAVKVLARLACALKECTNALCQKVEKLRSSTSALKTDPLHYPDPTPINGTDFPFKLTFKGILRRDNTVAHEITLDEIQEEGALALRVLYLADFIDADSDQPVEVIVKFTPTYGEEAHRLLAENKNSYAPKLYACERVVGRSWFMVVMERLGPEWRPLDCGTGTRALDIKGYKKLEEARKLLESHKLVHGDFRAVNVMINRNGTDAKIVDFDWACKEGQGWYWDSTNTNMGKEWHSEVKPKAKLKMEHDKYALEEGIRTKFLKSS